MADYIKAEDFRLKFSLADEQVNRACGDHVSHSRATNDH